jgi:hypothetical protein
MIEILNESIFKSWQGIFPLNNNQKQASKKEDLLPDWFTEETPQKKELNIDRSELIKKIKG